MLGLYRSEGSAHIAILSVHSLQRQREPGCRCSPAVPYVNNNEHNSILIDALLGNNDSDARRDSSKKQGGRSFTEWSRQGCLHKHRDSLLATRTPGALLYFFK